MGLTDIFPVLILIGVLVIGAAYLTTALGAVDENTDVSGTEYEEAYNLSTDTAQETLSMLAFMPWILCLVGLIIVFASLYRYMS